MFIRFEDAHVSYVNTFGEAEHHSVNVGDLRNSNRSKVVSKGGTFSTVQRGRRRMPVLLTCGSPINAKALWRTLCEVPTKRRR